MTQNQDLQASSSLLSDYTTRLVIVPRLEDWFDEDGNWTPDRIADMLSYADVDTETKEWNRMIICTDLQENAVRNASRFRAFRDVIKRNQWPYSLWHNYPGIHVSEPIVHTSAGLTVEVNIYGRTFARMIEHASTTTYLDNDPRRAILSDFFASHDLQVIRPGDGIQLTEYFKRGMIRVSSRSFSDPDHVVILRVSDGHVIPSTYEIPMRD